MEQTLTIGCPDCRDAGTPNIPLKTRPGFFGLYCEKQHVFQDSEELNNRKPSKIDTPAKPVVKLPMPGEKAATSPTGFAVNLPEAVQERLGVRFGANTANTIAAVLAAICEEGTFIVGEAEALRLGELLGQKVTNAQLLCGLVFSLKTIQLEAAPPPVIENRVINPDDIVLKFNDPGYLEKLKDRARFRGQTVDDILRDVIVHGLNNGWF